MYHKCRLGVNNERLAELKIAIFEWLNEGIGTLFRQRGGRSNFLLVHAEMRSIRKLMIVKN